MQEVRAARTRKKEFYLRIMLDDSRQKEEMQNLLDNIGYRTRQQDGINTIEALRFYHEHLKAGKR